jgi:hypothetical protein
MLVYGLAQCGESFAADPSDSVVKDMQPMVGGKPMPKAFMPALPANDFESPPTDFRAPKADILEAASSRHPEAAFQSNPVQENSTLQRLADYRTQGRVQLLTLWESPRNTVSLQAGRHGGPSLQWSSRVMNRAGARRGLLDRIVASSIGATGLRSKLSAHGGEVLPSSIPASK